jgi:hypothetical protein
MSPLALDLFPDYDPKLLYIFANLVKGEIVCVIIFMYRSVPLCTVSTLQFPLDF